MRPAAHPCLHASLPADRIPKNFRHCVPSRHSIGLCSNLCTDSCQPPNRGRLGPQPRMLPQTPRTCRRTIHNPPTPCRAHLPATNHLYAQFPQDLLLLLLDIYRFRLEEAPWGNTRPPWTDGRSSPACQPDGLAFKLSPKALRWFIDSRCGRRSAPGRRGVRSGKPLIDAFVGVCIEGTLWTWRRQVSRI